MIQDLSGMDANAVGTWLLTELRNRNNVVLSPYPECLVRCGVQVAENQGMQSMWEMYHLDDTHQLSGYWPKCKINSLRAAPHLKIQNVQLNADGVQVEILCWSC